MRTTERMRGVVRRLRRSALLDGRGLSDGALLTNYLAGREDAAFEGLVRRHGPMVYGLRYVTVNGNPDFAARHIFRLP